MLPQETWTSTQVKDFFKFGERNKSIQAIYNAEERGEIPKASRISRGKIQVRNWSISQIPDIGLKFGFIKRPPQQIVITKYIQKGGVLKTTTSINEARVFALNGLKTLVIGQDFECSITDILLPKAEITKLEEIQKRIGLFHFFAENAPIDDVICKTSIPTLDIIPETHDLVIFDKWLSQQKRREYIYESNLLPLLSQYDVIIFDNGPSWNHLIENSITVSNSILCPLGCNLLAYNASETNLTSLFEFFDVMKLENRNVIMFATLLERTSLSQQIFSQYIARFGEIVIPIPIKVSAKFQEALVKRQSIIEYAPNSQPAQEYFELIQVLWHKIIGDWSFANHDTKEHPAKRQYDEISGV